MENPISLQWGLIGTSGFADRIFAPALQQAGQVLIGAAVTGFVIGGGIAAIGGLFRRK